MFEGDRRFPIVVRLNDKVREDREALENIPVPLPPGPNGKASSVLLKQVAGFSVTEGPNQISRENGTRRVVVTANVRGRDFGSLVAEAQAKVGSQVRLPPGYFVTWGGQFENLASAKRRLMVVVPVCFFLIFLLLYSALGSPRDALWCSAPCRWPDRRHRGAVASRDAGVGAGRGRVHRAIRRGGPQRAGDADLHQAARGGRPAEAGGDPGGGHDGSGQWR